jgi:phosphate transport system substrate-binding protein
MRRRDLVGLLGLAGCGRSSSEGTRVIQVRGSETLLPLMQRWAVFYGERCGQVVSVGGGGSGTGIAGLLNGTVDVAMASRAIHQEERSKLARRGVLLERVVALDAISLYVHPSNPVREVSLEALREVFVGRQRSWTFLGGGAAPIATYSRENSSGTYAYFKEQVLKNQDLAPWVQCLPGTGSVVRAVSQNPKALGYGGAIAGGKVGVLAVRRGSGEAIAPSSRTAQDGSYPLARPLHVYVRGDAPEEARAFVRWLGSTEAQELAERTGFFPVGAEA